MHDDTGLRPATAGLLMDGLVALRKGDFSFRLPNDLTGLDGKLVPPPLCCCPKRFPPLLCAIRWACWPW